MTVFAVSLVLLSEGSVMAQDVVVDSPQTWSQDTTVDNLTVTPRGVLTLTGNTTVTVNQDLLVQRGGSIVFAGTNRLVVLGDARVNQGSRVHADGKGFPAEQGPGAGRRSNEGGSGGSFGGLGGAGYSQGGVNPFYGSALWPVSKGSGGGNGNRGGARGGAGGGVVYMEVAGTLTLNGVISANGANGSVGNSRGGGGGSGGTVRVDCDELTGSGRFEAKGGRGGDSRYDGGGGGGGRVLVRFSSGGLDRPTSSSVAGGWGYRSGAVGTLGFVKKGGVESLEAVGGWRWENTDLRQGAFHLVDVNLHDVVVTGPMTQDARVQVDGTLTVGGAANWVAQGVDWQLAARDLLVRSGSRIYVRGHRLDVEVSRDMALSGDGYVDATTLDMTVTGALSLQDTSYLKASEIHVEGGDVTVGPTARIDVSGMGFGPESGPGAGRRSNEGGSGASHGGKGGGGYSQGGVSDFYDSGIAPYLKGSGGGNGNRGSVPGGAGGGYVHIHMNGTVHLDGVIAANGANGATGNSRGGGGGAGGTIHVYTGRVEGAGRFEANGGRGGNSRYDGGGGGGGRIAVWSNELALQDPSASRVDGGWGYRSGEVGTLMFGVMDNGTTLHTYHGWRWEATDQGNSPNYLFKNVIHHDGLVRGPMTERELHVTELLHLGRQVTWNATFTGATFTARDAILDAGSRILGGTHPVTATVTQELQMLDTASVDTPAFHLEAGEFSMVGHAVITSTDVFVHAGDMAMEENALIDTSGRGPGAESGTAPGRRSNEGGSGASHGGVGGGGYSQGGVNGFYGSALHPETMGSGGGNGNRGGARGGNGGGKVRIVVEGAYTMDGQVRANGANGAVSNSRGGGGGSGGAIWVTTHQLSGAGTFHAIGGRGGDSRYDGGGGGGGRIAVYYDVGGLAAPQNSKVTGGWGYRTGEPGTLAFIDADDNAIYVYEGWRWEAQDAPFAFADLAAHRDTFVRGLAAQDVDITVDGVAHFGTGVRWSQNGQGLALHVGELETDGTFNLTGGPTVLVDTAVQSTFHGSTTVTATEELTFAGPGDVIVSNRTTLQAPRVVFEGIGDLTLLGTSTIKGNISGQVANLTLTVGGDTLDASGYGHGPEAGPGAGRRSNEGGSGGANGGTGGAGYSQGTAGHYYGIALEPVLPGSGGGNGNRGSVRGGNGGGVIDLVVENLLTNNGVILANGSNGATGNSRGGGGGGGGSIRIDTDRLAGTGKFQANGGRGGDSRYDGGGGGGGRIAVYYNDSTLEHPEQSTVAGGWGYRTGQGGTLVFIDKGADQVARVDDHLDIYHSWRWETEDDEFTFRSVHIWNSASVRGPMVTPRPITLSHDMVLADSVAWNANFAGLSLVLHDLHMEHNARIEGMDHSFTMDATGSVILDNGARIRAHDVTVTGTAAMTLDGAAYIQSGDIDVEVDDLTLGPQAYFTADGLGHGAESGPGAGYRSNEGGSGACHAGLGGAGYSQGRIRSYYGSAFRPETPGSGGGNGNRGGVRGGSGGGVIKVVVAHDTLLDGVIRANGANGAVGNSRGGGGGAGGSIWFTTHTLGGAGRFQANGGRGGDSRYDGGGGGGGRIAVYYAQSTLANPRASTVSAGWGYRYGTVGTLMFMDVDDEDILLVHGWRWEDQDAPFVFHRMATTPSTLIRSTDTPMTVEADEISVESGNTWRSQSAQVTLVFGTMDVKDLDWAAQGVVLDGSGSLTWSGSHGLSATELVMRGAMDLTMKNTAFLKAPTIRIEGIGDTNLMDSSHVDGNLSGSVANLAISPSASIKADGYGFPNEQGPGAGHRSNEGGSGGSHGGRGGAGYSQGQTRSFYGSALFPATKGSGGGRGNRGSVAGGNGGGLIDLSVMGTLHLDGWISANGTNGSTGNSRGGGGGAGGGIQVRCHHLEGDGRFLAVGGRGGDSRYDGGGGGGGRILVYYDTFALTRPTNSSVSGGAGYRTGSPGTLAFFDRDDRHLRIYQHWRWEDRDAPFEVRDLTLHQGARADGTSTALLVGVEQNTTFETGAVWDTSSADLTMETGSLLLQSSSHLVGGAMTMVLTVTDDLQVAAGATVESLHLTIHGLPDTEIEGNGVLSGNVVLVARNLNIHQNGRIDASGRGYGAEAGPGAGYRSNEGGSGASYGGQGGAGYSQNRVRAVYGSEQEPVEFGSGGGRGNRGGAAGGVGGGMIRVTVMGTLNNDGIIQANGTNGRTSNSRGGGGGSGGSVWLNTSVLQGRGIVRANGGRGGDSRYDGGGGGGGRVATCAGSNVFAGTVQALGAWGYRRGQDGTTFDACDFAEPPVFVLVSQGPNPPVNTAERPGTQGVVVAQLAVREFLGRAGRIDSVTFTAVGSLDDAAGIAGVSLYRDVNGDGRVDQGDELLGGPVRFQQDNGQITFQPGLVIPAMGTHYLLLVYDLTDQVANGQTFAVRFASNSDMDVQGIDEPGPGGVVGAPLQGAVKTIHIDPPPQVYYTDPGTVYASQETEIRVIGRYMTGATGAALTDPAHTALPIVRQVSDREIRVRVPQNVQPGAYYVQVTTAHGTNPTSSRRLVVSDYCRTGLPGICSNGRWMNGVCVQNQAPREETCGNGVDEDCDGRDLDCREVDQDGDGYSPADGDCDDTDPDINPDSGHPCGSGVVTYTPQSGLIQGQPNDAIVYSMYMDDDPDPSWREDMDASWYQEALSTLVDSAAWFGGPEDRVEVGPSIDLETPQDVTFSMWVKFDEVPGGQAHLMTSGGAYGFDVIDGRLSCRCGPPAQPGGEPSVLTADQVDLEPGRWYHLAGTFDGGSYRFFVNGEEVAEGLSDGSWTYDDSGVVVGPTPGHGWSGKVDDVRIFTRACTEQEIRRTWQLGNEHLPFDGNLDGLVMYLPFDTGPQDESGFGNHGTWTGGARITGRSSQPWFPDECHVVATAHGLDLIDGSTGKLWMRLYAGDGEMLSTGFERVVMLGGVLYAGTSGGSGLWTIDFRRDQCTHVDGTGTHTYGGGLASRFDDLGWALTSDTALPDDHIYDLYASYTDGHPYLAIGMAGALSLLDVDGGTVASYASGDPGLVFRAVAYAGDTLYFGTFDSADVNRNRLGAIYGASSLDSLDPMSAPFYRSAVGDVEGGAMGLSEPGVTIWDIDVLPGASEANQGDNRIFVATSAGAAVIDEHQGAEADGQVIYLHCTCGDDQGDDYYVLHGDDDDVRAISALPLLVGTWGGGVSRLDLGDPDPANWLTEYWTSGTALPLPSDNVTAVSGSSDLLLATDEGIAVVRYPDGPECRVPGLLGQCAVGRLRIVGDREICMRQFRPTNEVCNGLDDDCDGEVDEAPNGRSICGSAAPVVDAGQDITIEQAGCDPVAVDLPEPQVADDLDAHPFVTCDAPALFPLGATVVTCTATDLDGNVSRDSLTVTVVKTSAPAVTAPADVTVDAASPQGTEVELGNARVEDCDPGTVLTNDAPARFPVGTTVVTWTATDSFGNQGTDTQTVVVADDTPPTITLPGDDRIVVVDPEGDGVPRDEVDLPEAQVSDNADPNVVVTNDAPDVFPAGRTVVTYTAVDSAGNRATATVVVVVEAPGGAPRIDLGARPDGWYPAGPVSLEFDVFGGCDASMTVEVDPRDGQVIRAGRHFSTSYASEGRWPVEITATDGCGVSSTDRLSFGIDSTAPTFSASEPKQAGVVAGDPLTYPVWLLGEQVGLDVRAEDPGAEPSGITLVTIELLVDGQWVVVGRESPRPVAAEPTTWPSAIKHVGCNQRGGYCRDGALDLTELEPGDQRLRVTITDGAGNVTQGDLWVSVLDLPGVIERVISELEELRPAQGQPGRDEIDAAIAGLEAALPPAREGNIGSVLLFVQPAAKQLKQADAHVDCDGPARLLMRGLHGAVGARLREAESNPLHMAQDITESHRFFEVNYQAHFDRAEYPGCVLDLANAYFYLYHAVMPYDVDNFMMTNPVLLQIVDEMERYVDEEGAAPGEDDLAQAIPILRNASEAVREWMGMRLTSQDYVRMLLDFQDAVNTIISAEDNGAWIRNWAFGLMKVLRYLIQNAIDEAVQVLGRDDPDIQEALRLWDLGQGWIDDRMVDMFLDRYGDQDITCLIVKIHNKGWDPDVPVPDHCQ